MTLLLVALATVAVWRFRHRITPRGRALLLVVAVLGFNLAVGAPARAQAGCGEAPTPERPGTGMVGALDPPQGQGETNSPYLVYGYAGMVWHTYSDDCNPLLGGSVGPGATFDTWVGNQLFDVAKNIVGATNSLHYTLMSGGVLGALNEQIGRAAAAVFDSIFAQLFSVAMLILAVILFRHIWRGDFATVSKRALFAFAGMWLAASSLVLVSSYGRVDELIVTTTTGIQAGFVDPNEDRVIRDVLPTDLHTTVIYENWLRGEFGSPDSPQAREFGSRLLAAQAWTWDDVRQGRDANNATEQAKKTDYLQIATQLGSATGYFTGEDGSRIGAGFLALFQSIVYSLFPLLAKIAVLLAQLLLRILTLTAPIIGLIALIHHDILRRIGKAVGAIALGVLVLAALAGVHFRFIQLILSPDVKPPLLTQILLAGLVTVVFLRLGHPISYTWQMLQQAVAAATPTTLGNSSRSRYRGIVRQQQEVREGVDAAVASDSGTRSQRPEGNNPAVPLPLLRSTGANKRNRNIPAGEKPQPWPPDRRDPQLEYWDGIRHDGKPESGELKRTMGNIRKVQQKYNIKIPPHVRIKINNKLRDAHGETVPNGRSARIDLAPEAFVNEEQLARTLYHESVHYRQLSRNGWHYPSTRAEHRAWEREAYAAEDQWWAEHPINRGQAS